MESRYLHVSRRRVRFAETDCTTRVFFPRYVEWIDDAIQDFMRERGLEFDERGNMVHRGLRVEWTLVTGEYHCRMLKPLKLNDLLEIGIKVGRLGRRSLTFRGEVLREGELVAVGAVTYVCIDPRVMRSRELPRELVDALNAGGQSELGTSSRI
ncbi:MAG: acyl-CoA thioesterase [Thaumarchaeota archaeon]|nr:acyl-CoA thioesterase [Candidatus Calditenuaceae archaeon]MDW8186829.1 thioesterase family protein [Nitrososphaerota archaeon]